MLEPHHRLRGAALFQQLFAHGKRVFAGPWVGFSLPAKNDTLMVGVTFKQKAFPRSVDRHRYKRRILAWVRGHIELFPRGQVVAIHVPAPLTPFTPASLDRTLNQLVQSLKKI